MWADDLLNFMDDSGEGEEYFENSHLLAHPVAGRWTCPLFANTAVLVAYATVCCSRRDGMADLGDHASDCSSVVFRNQVEVTDMSS